MDLNIFCQLHIGQVNLKFGFIFDDRVSVLFCTFVCNVCFFYSFTFVLIAMMVNSELSESKRFETTLHKMHAQIYILLFHYGSRDKRISQSNTCDDKLSSSG